MEQSVQVAVFRSPYSRASSALWCLRVRVLAHTPTPSLQRVTLSPGNPLCDRYTVGSQAVCLSQPLHKLLLLPSLQSAAHLAPPLPPAHDLSSTWGVPNSNLESSVQRLLTPVALIKSQSQDCWYCFL